jgi:hypothetical protein
MERDERNRREIAILGFHVLTRPNPKNLIEGQSQKMRRAIVAGSSQ